ncbi:TonB-dependent receptor [Pseudomonas capsici]|uniref:TonB-dependent receptor n=1 Tax=Pseudomonas capsici TaxID=2810614 RepID=UPI0019D0A959|nr:TonB-dependent receptor [Pseudomonas capsici]MBN6714473.1 TonB-dependent receptor [Pseudomonas capsici]MBN6719580.1 TonB-dependent receptor [Pseudomonas capsici]MBN6724080.1 TonB-dependent receptor [Pseudomonas capsici]
MSRSLLFQTLANRSLQISLVALSPPALAADEPPLALPSVAITGSADTPVTDLATPTTSGSRLNLTALETPASTSSLDSHIIESRNNLTVQDAVSRSPGITSIASPGDGNTALSARGFTGHSSVMTLFDGSRLYTGAGTQTFPVDPFLVERIDVIRGPASVLYGEGATGAVINVVPKKPFEGEVRNRLRLGYGSNDRQQLGLDSGGSLSDTLSYRVTLNQQQSNGWVDNGNSRSLAMSAALRWQATDDLSFTLAHERGDSEPMNYFGTPLIDGRYRDSLRDKNYNLRNAVQRYNDEWTRLNSDWAINDNVSASNQLYYIKSRRHWRNAETYTWSSAQGQLLRGDYLEIKHDQEQIGDRQSFTFNHSLFGLDSRTVVGAEYNRIRFDVSNNSPYNDVGGDFIDPWSPASADFQSLSAFRPLAESTTRTFALFAENRLQLSERWSLVTGIRRDQNHIDRYDQRADSRSDRSLTGGNWRAGLVFAVTDQLSLYGQYSTSEDGVSNLISMNPTQQQMDLTEAKQTEFGLKQQFWDGRGEWTLAAYHIVKKKLLTLDPITRLTQQVGQQSSDGLEASLELALDHDWHVSANASVVRARYDDFDENVAGQVVSRAGNRPADVPRRTANLWVSKTLTEELDAGMGLRYVDRRYANTANTTSVPGYTVLDANLGWQVQRDVRLGLQLNNLLDRRYAASQYNNGQQWLMGEPRSFFVTADYSF